MTLKNDVLDKLAQLPATLPKTGRDRLEVKRNREIRAALIEAHKKRQLLKGMRG